VLRYRGFWSLLCGPFYAHAYTKWRVVLCCASLLLRLASILVSFIEKCAARETVNPFDTKWRAAGGCNIILKRKLFESSEKFEYTERIQNLFSIFVSDRIYIYILINFDIYFWYSQEIIIMPINLKAKLCGFSPQANYTDQATAACRRNCWQLLRIEGVAWSTQRIPTAVISFFYTPELILFHSTSSSVILTRLSGPRSRPTTSQKIW
jgi:hypothetical protein